MGKGTVNLTRHVSLTSVGMGTVSLASFDILASLACKGTASLASKGVGSVSIAIGGTDMLA